MKVTIDSAGRLVIPKTIREAAGLVPGARLDIRLRDGHVEIEAEPVNYRLEWRDGWLHAIPDRELPPVTHEMVQELIRQDREERGLVKPDGDR